MKNVRHVKQLIKEWRIVPGEEMHRRTLSAVLKAHEETTKRKSTATQLSICETIVRSRMSKFAVAAVIILVVMIVLNQFSNPIDVSNVVWGDVRDAFLAKPWVHLKYDNGKEIWYDLNNGRIFAKNWTWDVNDFSYRDKTLNIKQTYNSRFGEHILEVHGYLHAARTWDPKTPWEMFVGPWETITGTKSKGNYENEKSVEYLDGKTLIRFDRFHNDAVGRRLLVYQLWADPETRLPVKVRVRLQVEYRQRLKREFITGEFDFPQKGPTSIYDLGVPRDLPIVKESKHRDIDLDPSIEGIIKASEAHYENFPKQYRSIRWDNDKESEIDIVWRNDEKTRFCRYFNEDKRHPQYHLNLPASAEDVIKWSTTQIPVNIQVHDGMKSYNRRNPRPGSRNTHEPTVRVLRSDGSLSIRQPNDDFWPYAFIRPNFQIMDDLPEELSDCIWLRVESGAFRNDFYIDPEHDYICVRWIRWRLKAGPGSWEKEATEQRSDFAQLPQGQWYPRRLLTTFGDPEKSGIVHRGGGRSRRSSIDWNIDIQILDGDEYPPDTFNGEKLLENAKVETY
jgi:hypothetical protein